MSLRINHPNHPTVGSLMQLSKSQETVQKSLEKLASGLRKNSMDNSSIAISDKMRGQISANVVGSNKGQTGTVDAVKVATNTQNSTSNSTLSLSDANARINATEMNNIGNGMKRFQSMSILQQSGTSTLAQANSAQNQVMQLLR